MILQYEYIEIDESEYIQIQIELEDGMLDDELDVDTLDNELLDVEMIGADDDLVHQVVVLNVEQLLFHIKQIEVIE